MKSLRYIGVLSLLLGGGAMAQIQVELAFDQGQYLPEEQIPAKVRIHNSSGQTLILGKDNSWLDFDVEALDGSIVRLRKPLDVTGEFSLPSAHRATRVVHLNEFFEMLKYGRYEITASVTIQEWGGQVFHSREKSIDISTGVKLWETAYGIPHPDRAEPPEIRKFILAQANHVKDIHLYLRITDQSEQHTYKLFSIGPMISFSKPEAQLDQWSNLHVLYQQNARSFLYTVVTPDGLLLARQTWDYTETRPQLVGGAGKVTVRGGVRRISASDLPPPELLSERSNIPPGLEADADKLADVHTKAK